MNKIIKVLPVALMLTLASLGCKGEKGSQGPTGPAGPLSDPSAEIITLEGVVPSNDFTVLAPLDSTSIAISVYVGDILGDVIELPVWLPGPGLNAYFLARTGEVQIINALLAGANSYRIVIIREPTGSSRFEKVSGI